MIRRISVGAAAALAASLLAAGSATADAQVPLLMDQNTAFSILGVSCGGIQEQVTATGFDPATGDPQGNLELKTSCGGSGKDGGGHTTTYTATEFVTWNFDGTIASYVASGTGSGVFTDAHGDTLVQQGTSAYVDVLAVATPTNLTESKSGGQFLVGWTPDPTSPPDLIGSTTITATPTSGNMAVITSTITGPASSGLLGPLNPNTSYQVTVVNNDAAGPSPASAPITITTGKSVLKPGAPTSLTAAWTSSGNSPDPLVIDWAPGVPGDSPVDKYQLVALASGSPLVNVTVAAPAVTDTISTLDDGLNWFILIRAHDAAGWGRWAYVKVAATNG